MSREERTLEFHKLALWFKKWADDREAGLSDTICGWLALEVLDRDKQTRQNLIKEILDKLPEKWEPSDQELYEETYDRDYNQCLKEVRKLIEEMV